MEAESGGIHFVGILIRVVRVVVILLQFVIVRISEATDVQLSSRIHAHVGLIRFGRENHVVQLVT